MFDFIIKFLISFVFSTCVSLVFSFMYFYISYLLVNYFKLNYHKNGAYWVINFVIILTIITWLLSFFYCVYKIKIASRGELTPTIQLIADSLPPNLCFMFN